MKKKRAAAAAAAVVTTAGVAVGGVFPSPHDLLDPDQGPAPVPITEMLTPEAEAIDMTDDDPGTEEDEDELRRRSSPAARFRALVLRLPLAVRLGAGVPLWCLGWLTMTALSGLWSVLLSPALGTALSWAAGALLLLGALLLTVKAALPEVPLKKLVNRRNLLALLLGAMALGVLDAALPLVFDGYERWEALFRAVTTAGLLCALTAAVLCRQRKEAPAEAPEEPEETEEPETLEQAQERALRFVREMADEVSPRRRV